MLLALIKKEFLALMRDVHGLAALFAMPLMFIIVMSLALKDAYNPPLRTLSYALVNADTGTASAQLVELWRQRHGSALVMPADWQDALRKAELRYVLRLDEGLSAELAEPALPVKARIHFIAEPGMDASLYNTLRAELGELAGELKARLILEQADQKPVPGAGMGRLVEAERFDSKGPRPSSVQQNVPAWLVFGMFFVVAGMAGLFVQERSCGALARLYSLGVPRWLLLLSKALPYLVVNAVQAALMLAVGVWLMPHIGGDGLSLAGVSWPALCVVLLAIGCSAVGLALLLACLVRSHVQASTVGPVLNILMGAIGGIMVPQFAMPVFMQRLADVSPMHWGLEALLTVLLRGGGVSDALPWLARLGGFGLLAGGAAWLLLRRNRQ